METPFVYVLAAIVYTHLGSHAWKEDQPYLSIVMYVLGIIMVGVAFGLLLV